MEAATKIKSWIKTIFDVIKAYGELKSLRRDLEHTKLENEALHKRNLELAEEAGTLKGELSGKTKDIERLNVELTRKSQEIGWKNDEILRLQQELTALQTNFEEKVRIEAEKRLHYHIPEVAAEVKNDFIPSYLSKSWTITCNKCHCRFSLTLNPVQIAELIKGGYTTVDCLNRNCVDEYLFGVLRNPHRITVRLEDFVESIMNEKFAEKEFLSQRMR